MWVCIGHSVEMEARGHIVNTRFLPSVGPRGQSHVLRFGGRQDCLLNLLLSAPPPKAEPHSAPQAGLEMPEVLLPRPPVVTRAHTITPGFCPVLSACVVRAAEIADLRQHVLVSSLSSFIGVSVCACPPKGPSTQTEDRGQFGEEWFSPSTTWAPEMELRLSG